MRYPLVLTLRASRRARFLIAAIHLVAAIAFMLSSIERALLLPLLLLLAVSSWRALHAEGKKAGRVLVLEDAGLLRLSGPGGERPGRPLPGCADFGMAVWLSWRTDEAGRGARKALMLLPDSVPAGSWRAVRTWLRHKAASASGAEKSGV